MRKIKVKNKHIWIYSIIIFLISLSISFYLCKILTPKIYLEEKKITFSYQEEITLPEHHAYYKNKDISKKVTIDNSVNNKKLGKYLVKYHLNNFLFPVTEYLLVEIVDNERPVISLNGGDNVILCPNSTYQELGYQAIDNYDGDITKKVEITKEDNKILYQVKDTSGNLSETTRKIKYDDIESPILTLKGKEKITIYKNNTYQELGYDVTDNCDKDISKKVKISGTVDTTKEGTYKIYYKATDNSGNLTTKVRTIEVLSKKITPSSNQKGIIYLTFDDGPSKSITPAVLNILKEEQVEATFFVVHHDPSLNYLIKREHNEGHTVALHSYTHNYQKIYQSTTAYFDDLTKIQNEVASITGVKSTIIRFPGGSSNTISKRYKPGIMTSLTKEVLEKGYSYFDWNVSSGDAEDVKSSREVYQNVINGLSPNRANVVLMHDFENNTYTLNALRDIINYGKENGYTFKKITKDTPMITHRITN